MNEMSLLVQIQERAWSVVFSCLWPAERYTTTKELILPLKLPAVIAAKYYILISEYIKALVSVEYKSLKLFVLLNVFEAICLAFLQVHQAESNDPSCFHISW